MKRHQLVKAVLAIIIGVAVMPQAILAMGDGSGIIGKKYAGGSVGYYTGGPSGSIDTIRGHVLGNMNVHESVDARVHGEYGTGSDAGVDKDIWSVGAGATGFMPISPKAKGFVVGDVFYRSIKLANVTTKKAGAQVGGGIEYLAFDKGWVTGQGVVDIWDGNSALIVMGEVGYWMSETMALTGGADYNFDSEQIGLMIGGRVLFN